MEDSPQRQCPNCGTPVAQKADTCLLCGAELKEEKKRRQLPQGDLLLPLLLVVAIAALWLWKPWEQEQPLAMVSGTAVPTATAEATSGPPTATYAVALTATPLHSPTPEPTATLPPNQTYHTIESGETVSAVAKQYGTTVSKILAANGLKSNSIISIGDVLIIPLPVANTSTPTVTPTPSPTPFEYTVRVADTLSAIAKKYGTTVETLMSVNNIVDATSLRVGTKIIIAQPPDFTSTMAYETHEVVQGDTLFSLSSKYDVTVAEIKEASGLESNNLSVGQELKIPVGTATPTPTLTPTATLTPTPGPPRPAPQLLAPPDGAAFEGAGTVILLNWASVGILDGDEWYVVRLGRMDPRAEQPPLHWTKSTSWRVPEELYVAGPEAQDFRWQVSIMRQTGVDEDGNWVGEAQSPSSETRTFSWR
jgi:LysM repeat protein